MAMTTSRLMPPVLFASWSSWALPWGLTTALSKSNPTVAAKVTFSAAGFGVGAGGGGAKVTFAATVGFDFDKAVVKPQGKAQLDQLANKTGGINLEVVIAIGHADVIGSDAYNQKLSVRRAEAIKAYLVSKGIEPNRIYTEGKGEKQPVTGDKS